MTLLTPVRKVSFGLVMMAVSLLMLGEVIGVIPSEHRGFLEGRRTLCESLAVQFSRALGDGDLELVGATLKDLVKRDGAILSAAVLTNNGRQQLVAGQHAAQWRGAVANQSTSTHVEVPVFKGDERWGSIQVAFTPLPTSALPYSFGQPLLPLFAYMTVACFVGFLWFVRRTLKELDPSSVIPERVKSAFETLAEGLVIMDEKENIILANAAFSEKIEIAATDLIGRSIASLGWDLDKEQIPWRNALTENRRQMGGLIRFQPNKNQSRTFTVNTTPISDSKGVVRGAMTTFNDLTDLERKQAELRQTVSALEKSRQELQDKTVQLELLATRDPLTGLLNRRAFFEQGDNLFADARQNESLLACIMTDIDHFKLVNDNHGHATGDKVIQLVASELRNNGRPNDVVGRYGGEEFCIILPGVELETAMTIAERLRVSVKGSAQKVFEDTLRITSSFGVAMLDETCANPADLVALADKALYRAKETGRNRVVAWDGVEIEAVHEDSVAPSPEEGAEARDLVAEGEHANLEMQFLTTRIAELEAQLVSSEQAHTDQVGHDGITGLPNRLLLIDRIRQAVALNERIDRTVAVIVLDIDLFRRINDALGYAVGDKVLASVGERLTEVLRLTDSVAMLGDASAEATVSRTGADEFGILITDLQDPEAATWVVKRILENMAKPLTIDGNEIFLSCSAGISLFPHDTEDPEMLLAHASSARYNAKKRAGSNKFSFFADEVDQTSNRHLWLEGQLHNALEKGEFSLHYQPKVNLSSGLITGMEGLIRWNHPKLGNVSPVDFIPVAERSGLINDIGRWVLETGCAQSRQWADAGFPDVVIAVNVSALQLRQEDLCEQISGALERNDLRPAMLELEVTESAVMENFEESIAVLKKITATGVHIAIDDFGTGYSSLAYLKHMPAHTLKIDRSFLSDTVPDEQDKLIITAIIAMAHSMKLSVVAEGVETDTQRSFLKALECDEMQGYLFSKPVSGEASLALLKHHDDTNSNAATTRKIA